MVDVASMDVNFETCMWLGDMAHEARKSMGVGANKHHAQPIAMQRCCEDSARWWHEMVL